MSKFTLTYFNIRARAEVSRLMFALAEQEYEDNRVTGDSWQAFKPKTPLGQLPCLEIEGEIFCQSHSLERYLAKKFGLYGETDLEQLKCDMIVDSLEDMFRPFTKVFSAKEEEREKMVADYVKDTAEPFLKKIGGLVKKYGYVDSDKITWVDIAIFSMLENFVGFGVDVKEFVEKDVPELNTISKKVESNPKIAAWLKKRPVTKM